MSNRAAFGPGKGAIGFERLGGWRTSPADAMSLGAPLVFTASGTFRSKYGELYKITGVGGGGNGSANVSLGGCCGFVAGGGGAGGAGFQMWWVGDGSVVNVTIGPVGGTTSFGTIATAAGNGGNATGPTGAILIAGPPATPFVAGVGGFGGVSLFGFGGPGVGYGSGGKGQDSSGGAIGTGTPGIVIIERALPALNSQGSAWEPEGAGR
jgi:hypothetical protein